MANKMLIDATHPEETRVVVLRGSRIEEFDFESASKRQLRGNIYLAKVIRVEPSLQAAFVDYGGNRHGFLAFSEIHPDYYQIPFSDRQALLEEEVHEEQEEEEERRPRRSRRRRGGERQAAAENRNPDDVVREASDAEGHEAPGDDQRDFALDESDQPATPPADEHDVRPVHLDASETPPYDDPTPDLIQRASEVREREAHDTSRHPHPDDTEVSTPPTSVVGAGEMDTAADRPIGAQQSLPETFPAAIDQTVAPVDNVDEGALISALAAPTDADVDTGSSVEPSDAPGTLGEVDHQALTPDHHPASQRDDQDDADEHEHDEDEQVEQIGGDAMEEIPRQTYRPRRQYKIQEVIKRRQVLLVQVVKEERGNKGAALTTYLSLAGRYSVLMPNTARGGGISRKITDAGDRQRLKSIAQELEVPDGMGVILRTAGAMRTKPEVKRDFEYLMRMWETVREMTLASSAPKLVYEEGSLIKRAIRDLYNKDVEEIVVAGEAGYHEARDFMRLLMPSHAKNVQPWRDQAPLFTKAGAEAQLDAMFSNNVTLKSGGYLVINQTEALVAIDVNSGRSTREHNIEDTALRTNLEAADEVARQLRLRDLAGLIVVDFIDMEETRNNRSVEKRMKDALKDDRARIQIGRISHFGLLEMSRQRIRTGVLEGSTEVCQHCAGAGMVRSTASIALHVLRVLEDTLISDATRNVTVRTRGIVALYILNNKRSHLSELEGRFGVAVCFESDEHLTGTTYCGLERGEPATGPVQPIRPAYREELEAEPVAEPATEDDDVEVPQAEARDTDENDARRRRRRRRGRGRDRESSGITDDAPQPADDALSFISDVEGVRTTSLDDEAEQVGASEESQSDDSGSEVGDHLPPREDGRTRRRRSRRGGRRGREMPLQPLEAGQTVGEDEDPIEIGQGEPSSETTVPHDAMEPPTAAIPATFDQLSNHVAEHAMQEPSAAPSEPASAPLSPAVDDVAPVSTPAPVDASLPLDAAALLAPVDAPSSSHGSQIVEDSSEVDTRAPRRPEPVSSELDPSRPKRSGWWQRAKATLGG